MIEPPPSLLPGTVHVWRIALDDADAHRVVGPLLSADERERAQRFHRPEHRRRFTVAHGWKRRLLAAYVGQSPDALRFECGPHGKPALVGVDAHNVHFNLSHSGGLALVAVRPGGPVGVDIECWNRAREHFRLAQRAFSAGERAALEALAGDADAVVAAFYDAWSRKEAYLKATGHGVTRGLHHFDVTLAPQEPARLVADRRDDQALERWRMVALTPAPDFSGALVAAAPFDELLLFDRPE